MGANGLQAFEKPVRNCDNNKGRLCYGLHQTSGSKQDRVVLVDLQQLTDVCGAGVRMGSWSVL